MIIRSLSFQGNITMQLIFSFILCVKYTSDLCYENFLYFVQGLPEPVKLDLDYPHTVVFPAPLR